MEAATTGVGVGNLKLGRDHINECLGIKLTGDSSVKTPTSTIKPPSKKNTTTDPRSLKQKTKTQQVVANIDAAKEIERDLSISKERADGIVKNSKDPTDSNIG